MSNVGVWPTQRKCYWYVKFQCMSSIQGGKINTEFRLGEGIEAEHGTYLGLLASCFM